MPITNHTIKNDVLKSELTTDIQQEQEFGSNAKLDSYTVTIGDTDFKDGNGISLKEFGKGQHELTIIEKAQVTDKDGKKFSIERQSNAYLFQQDYSLTQV